MPAASPDLVVASDPDFLYVSKPAGLPTLLPNDGSDLPSVAGLLLKYRPEQAEALPADLDRPGAFAAGILHRLDTWTSGLVLVARHPEAFARGRGLFAQGRLAKHYRFLTERKVQWTSHVVEHPLAHSRTRRSRMVWQRGPTTPHRGKWYPAATTFRRLSGRGRLTLWEAVIRSGVTHQVRVHAASVGLPLLGDRLYGGGDGPMDGRFFLHHHHLEGWPGSPPAVSPPGDWP